MDTFLLYIMKLMACTPYQQEIDPGSLCSVFSLVDAHLLYEINWMHSDQILFFIIRCPHELSVHAQHLVLFFGPFKSITLIFFCLHLNFQDCAFLSSHRSCIVIWVATPRLIVLSHGPSFLKRCHGPFYHHVPWPGSSYSYAKVHAVTKMAICSKLARAVTTKIDLSAK